MEQMRDRLLQLLREKSLKIGRFKLVSGMISHYYFDSKLTTLDPEGGYLTAPVVLRNAGAVMVPAEVTPKWTER